MTLIERLTVSGIFKGARIACGLLGVFLCSASAWAQVPQGTVEYYHVDAIGSVRAVTDQQRNVVRRHNYFAFGEEYMSDAGADSRRFTGKERDAETGFDYFGARYYRAASGRFMTVDPNHVGGDIFDPQSWNAYGYARNNPLRYVDPDGQKYEVCSGGSCGTVSDLGWERIAGNPGAGISLRDGWIIATVNGQQQVVGYYRQTEVDPTFASLLQGIGNRAAPGVNGALALGAATTALPLLAIGGGAVVAGGGSALTSLAIGGAPLLPAVPGAVAKLQGIGLTIQQASEIVTNPASQRLIDRANSNNINVIKQVGDRLVRITLDPTGQRIISAGYIQARNIANSIASGRFIPQ